jgi:hypothetical protein
MTKKAKRLLKTIKRRKQARAKRSATSQVLKPQPTSP